VGAQSATQSLNPTVLEPTQGEALWFNNDLIVVKATGAETAGDFLLISNQTAARTSFASPPDNCDPLECLLLHNAGSNPP